jgi:stage V sporulation protein SpoVS
MDADIVLKVSANKDPSYPKKVAGAIGWRLREAGYCKIRAIKMDAVNTAIKAAAIINQRTKPAGVTFGLDFFFASPEDIRLEDEAEPTTAVAMTMHEVTSSPPAEVLEYKVSGKSEDGEEAVNRLAGALASPARGGKGIRMRCIGAAAVYKAVLACIVARGYLHPNEMEVIAIPTWDTVVQQDKPISLIQIEFWAKKMES